MDLTLGLLVKGNRILLGMKKRGFGAGRWNGFGGKVQRGESVEEAMAREYLEESGIKVAEYEKTGVINFEFKGDPEILKVHIFKVIEYAGEPKETEEMKPQWFDISEIPYGKMWPDDKIWMPLFLAGKKFLGEFLFKDKDEILSHKLNEVSSL